jgi:hypothetical protein
MDRASGARAGLEMRSIAARHRVAEDCLISEVDRGTPSTRRGPTCGLGPKVGQVQHDQLVAPKPVGISDLECGRVTSSRRRTRGLNQGRSSVTPTAVHSAPNRRSQARRPIVGVVNAVHQYPCTTG